jgi:hypothetical protein
MTYKCNFYKYFNTFCVALSNLLSLLKRSCDSQVPKSPTLLYTKLMNELKILLEDKNFLKNLFSKCSLDFSIAHFRVQFV